MTAREDIRTLSVPFATGIAAGVFLPLGEGLLVRLSVLLLAATACLGAGALLFRSRCWGTVILLLALAGLFAGTSSRIAGVFPSSGGSGRDPVTAAALDAAAGMKEVIGAIPYSTPQANGLVMALITGDRSALSKDTVSTFRKAGASHILALSGLHLGIIYAIFLALMAPAGNGPGTRKLRSILIVSIMGFYAIATGASPSIMRAFLFILLGELAGILHRQRSGMLTWCGALTIQLASAPMIVKSVGFQLSYLAMAGIFILMPKLQKFWPQEQKEDKTDIQVWASKHLNIPRKIWDAAALAISCQVFTAPAVWAYFGTFPRYFLITNLFAMPLTTLTMVLAVAAIALSTIGICPELLVTASDISIKLLLFVLDTIASL